MNNNNNKLSNQEIQAENEEKVLQTQVNFDPISDDEKYYALSPQYQPAPEVSQCRLGKRQIVLYLSMRISVLMSWAMTMLTFHYLILNCRHQAEFGSDQSF